MNRSTFAFTLLALPALWLGTPDPAAAGRSCEERPPTIDALRRGLALADSTAQALDATGAQVVVLARAGQDLRRYGLAWSHLGFAYRSSPGNWLVVHKLNACGAATAGVYRQGLAEFFTDDPYRHEAALMPLLPTVAARLLPVLHSNDRVVRLHEPSYSVVAYPWAQTYQQSNQWAIETLASAMDDSVSDRRRAQAWLMLRDYRPTTLHLHTFQRLGARITRANVAFDDHPNDKRFNDRIETVTADSVLQWLSRSGMAEPLVIVR